jgi:hypothetical protein
MSDYCIETYMFKGGRNVSLGRLMHQEINQ